MLFGAVAVSAQAPVRLVLGSPECEKPVTEDVHDPADLAVSQDAVAVIVRSAYVLAAIDGAYVLVGVVIAPPTGGVSVTDVIVAGDPAAFVTLAASAFVVPRGITVLAGAIGVAADATSFSLSAELGDGRYGISENAYLGANAQPMAQPMAAMPGQVPGQGMPGMPGVPGQAYPAQPGQGYPGQGYPGQPGA